ncbi:hypothetical protein GGX14DRAFT_406300 [Mycena pura]|uniref:Uncharacterized protein n=1 Tax=Mycena pura TaxID=153505 RepID=A0AAD6UUM8_9AGAR|nr:hypothetical protein GGX14DRAFT_406300 [Mycena pura]
MVTTQVTTTPPKQYCQTLGISSYGASPGLSMATPLLEHSYGCVPGCFSTLHWSGHDTAFNAGAAGRGEGRESRDGRAKTPACNVAMGCPILGTIVEQVVSKERPLSEIWCLLSARNCCPIRFIVAWDAVISLSCLVGLSKHHYQPACDVNRRKNVNRSRKKRACRARNPTGLRSPDIAQLGNDNCLFYVYEDALIFEWVKPDRPDRGRGPHLTSIEMAEYPEPAALMDAEAALWLGNSRH